MKAEIPTLSHKCPNLTFRGVTATVLVFEDYNEHTDCQVL